MEMRRIETLDKCGGYVFETIHSKRGSYLNVERPLFLFLLMFFLFFPVSVAAFFAFTVRSAFFAFAVFVAFFFKMRGDGRRSVLSCCQHSILPYVFLPPCPDGDHPFVIQLTFGEVGRHHFDRHLIAHPELPAAASAYQAIISFIMPEVVVLH